MSTKIFSTIEETLVFMTECTLATVETLQGLKSASKSEYKRQKNIAQIGIDHIISFNITVKKCFSTPRVSDVILNYHGNVEEFLEANKAKYGLDK